MSVDKDLVALAESGDAEAMLRLARQYLRGDGVQKDRSRGGEWLERAADAAVRNPRCPSCGRGEAS